MTIIAAIEPVTDCCFEHDSAGCDDRECEAIVCTMLPLCCGDRWENVCSLIAKVHCDVCKPDSPHVVQCVSGEGPDTVLAGFTITGGNATGPCCGPDTSGAGMYNVDTSPTVIGCVFADNLAVVDGSNGGGMFNSGGSPLVIGCTISGNVANKGGGIYNNAAHPIVIDCHFTTNHSIGGVTLGYGGGMYNTNASHPVVLNCRFVGNSSAGGAGMSNFHQSAPAVINCTFYGNAGTGMYSLSFSEPTVSNSIFWENSGSEISGATTVRFSDVQGGFDGLGNIDADPMFVDPDNGDYRLSTGSPCIDTGDNTAVPQGVLRDLDGNPRFVADACAGDSGATVDMGAYEFQGTSCNLSNILAMLASWGYCDDCGKCRYDFDGDCSVGILDLLVLLGNWTA